MISPIISPVVPLTPDRLSVGSIREQGAFSQVMEAAIGRAEASKREAGVKVDQFLSGDSEDLHATALAVQRADLEFEMFMQVRNRVVQAYQEIMRTQM